MFDDFVEELARTCPLLAWKKPVKFPKCTLVICKDVVHLAVRDQPNPTSRRECPSMINNMELSSLLSFDPSHPRRIFTWENMEE